MGKYVETPITIKGKKAIIVHDLFCANGPVDPETGEPLIDPETGEPYRGKNDDMADLMHTYTVNLRGRTNLANGASAPKYGVFSLLGMNTPIFVYDHPALVAVCNTAFTDGQNMFVCADYMREMVEQEEACNYKKSGMIWTFLHELSHKMLCHVTRMTKFPMDIRNIAADLVINAKLHHAFKKTVDPVPLLVELAYGMKPGDADKYGSMAEEVVAESLYRAQKKKEQEKEKKKKQKQASGGSGSDSESKDSSGDSNGDSESNSDQKSQKGKSGNQKSNEEQEQDQDQDSKQNGPGQKPQSGKNEKDSNGGSGQDDNDEEDDDEEDNKNMVNGKYYSPTHHMTPEELLDLLEENNLYDTVGKALNLPRRDDEEGIKNMKEKNRSNIIEAIQTAVAEASRCSTNDYPGAHIASHASDVIGGLDRGKLTYKLIIRKHFLGDGLKLIDSDDEASIMLHIPKESTGIEPFYMGSSLPFSPDEAVLVIVDMSGSTGGEGMRKTFLEEACNIQKACAGGDSARKVFIQSADTILRGEPVLITSANIDKMRHDGIPVFGDGGTALEAVLVEALNQPMLAKEKIKTVFFFTDCGDAVPKRSAMEKFIEQGIKIIFITTPGMFNEKWNQELDWTEMYCTETGTIVDATKSEAQQTRNTRNMKKNRIAI